MLNYVGSTKQKRFHTMQLVLLDRFKASKFMGNFLSKSCRHIELFRTQAVHFSSIISIYFSLYLNCFLCSPTSVHLLHLARLPTGYIRRVYTMCWNSWHLQFAALVKLDPVHVQKMLEDTKGANCSLTKWELEMWKEVWKILEPAYSTTLIMQEETALISLVAWSGLIWQEIWSFQTYSMQALFFSRWGFMTCSSILIFLNHGKTIRVTKIDTSTFNFI